MNNILIRSASGGVYVALLIIAVVFHIYLSIGIFGIIAVVALFEYAKLFKAKNIQIDGMALMTSGLGLYLVFTLSMTKVISAFWLGLMPVFLLIPMILSLFDEKENSLLKGLLSISGLIYILLPLMLIHFLYEPNADGEIKYFWPVMGMMILTWTSDTFAYLTGRFIGKTKLFERISPKKTWEGVVGGVVFCIIAAFVIDYFDKGHSIMFWIVLSILIPVAGILGDLFESLMKRTAGVKDSGNFIPGHGGILDRIDAMLFTVPITFAWSMLYNIF